MIPEDEKPILTPDRTAALQALFARTVQLVAIGAGWNRCCLDCEHFTESTELCALAGQRPPARVIVHGCPAHSPKPF